MGLHDLAKHRAKKLAELKSQQPHLSDAETEELDRSRTRSPDKRAYRDLPVTSFSDDFDLVAEVKGALKQLENGQFQRAAELADVMTRDDRVAGVLGTRVNALLGRPVEIAPANDTPKAQEIADKLQLLWPRMFPIDQLAALARWGIHLGLGLGELLWETDPEGWLPVLKVWHPRYIYWRWDTYSFLVVTADGQLELKPGDGKWCLLAPGGRHQRGWMVAAMRSLAVPWLIRSWAYRDWARYSEVHGFPTRKATVPTEADKEDKDRFFAEVRGLGSEPTVLLPKNKDGEGFDITLLEATSQSWDGFEGLIAKCETSIAIAVLGQNLTTEGGPHVGTADVQDDVRRDYLRNDAAVLATTVREQILRPWAEYNFGDPDLAPIPSWDVEPPEDHQSDAMALETAGGALTSLNAALQPAGKTVDAVAFAERFDIPIVDAPILPPAAPSPFGSPFGGGSPPAAPLPSPFGLSEAAPVVATRALSGRLRVENKIAVVGVFDHQGRMLWGRRNDDGLWTTPGGHLEPGETPEQGALRELAEEAGLQPDGPLVFLGRGKGGPANDLDIYCFAATCEGTPSSVNDPDKEVERWEWVDVTHGLPEAMREQLHVPAAKNVLLQSLPAFHVARHAPPPANVVEGQRFADDLVAKARARAAQVLQHDIRALRSEIDASSSAADLRVRLLRRYRTMDAATLAKLVEKVLLLGELAGRHAALKGT